MFFTCCKNLGHGASSFTFHPKENVLQIFIVIKNPSPRLLLNPRLFGPVPSTLTTKQPRRLGTVHQNHSLFCGGNKQFFVLSVK
jgi:hypothetical protein